VRALPDLTPGHTPGTSDTVLARVFRGTPAAADLEGRRKWDQTEADPHFLVPGGIIAAGMEGGGNGTAELLGRVPLFTELSPEELERIASVAIPRSFPRGVRVFHEGDNSDACYIVRSGDLRVTREHPDGRAIALATLASGDIFGELAMLDGEARSASVEALSDCELLALPASDVRALLASNAEITVKLVIALTRRVRDSNERISRQSFQTVPSRVAGVLSQLIAEEGASEGRDGITIRMTQADLAQLAGTSRESVSRFLATLERAGVVQVGRGRVTVIEPERLDAYIF
jgi:CRP/FNR family cyclic AMP-dependent transcriptional regulator